MKTVCILSLLLLPYIGYAQQAADVRNTDGVMATVQALNSTSCPKPPLKDLLLFTTPFTQNTLPALYELLIPRQATDLEAEPTFLRSFDCDAVIELNNLSAALRLRSLSDQSENDDNLLSTKPFTIVDLSAMCRFEKFEFFVVIENIFNEAWNEAQFDTGMQLWGESPDIASQLHLMPSSPRSLRLGVIYNY
jgi:hypothetical protein